MNQASTWLPPTLPPGWSVARLQHVARIYAGGTPDRSRPDYWEGGNVPWLNSGSVNQKSITQPSGYITRFAADSAATRWARKGDLLLALAGQGRTKGTVARLEIDATFNQSVAALRLSGGMNPSFVYYWLDSNYQNLRNMAGGDLRDGLNLSLIGSVEVPIAPLGDQKRIADYLDHETAEIDALVADLTKMRDLTRDLEFARRERLIVNEGPTPIELRRCRPVCTSGTSVNGSPWPASGGESGVLKTGAASQGRYRPHENKAVTDPAEQARLSAPVASDRVLVNRANTPAFVGSAAYVQDADPNLYLSDKLWSLDFNGVNEYFSFAMQTRRYRDQAAQRASGASLSMQNLSYSDFLSIRLPVPSEERQRTLCDTLRRLDASIEATNTTIDTAIALAKERRAALITAAVTGQIDVSAKNRPAAEQLEDDIKELP